MGPIGLSGAGAFPVLGVIPDVIDLGLTAVEYPFGKFDGWDLALGAAGIFATLAPIAGDGAAATAKITYRATKACCCFPAGTPVVTEHGTVPIERIVVGQMVYARDPATGATRLKPVTEVMITEPKPLFVLTTKDGLGNRHRMEVTDNHPYWVKNQGWVDAQYLIPGMVLMNLKGEELSVEFLEKAKRSEVAYNFTVANFHTYFAGNQNILVHNCNGLCKVGQSRQRALCVQLSKAERYQRRWIN